MDKSIVYRGQARRGCFQAITALGASALILSMPNPANAADFTVTNNSSSGSGSFAEAMDMAESTIGADTIRFDSGVFAQPQRIELSRQFTITEDLSIMGPGDDLLTLAVVPGTGTIGTFYVNGQGSAQPPNLVVEELSIEPTATAEMDRYFFMRNSNLDVSDVNMTGTGVERRDSSGGAIAILNGDLMMTDCTVENFNTQHRGGGVFLSFDAAQQVMIDNSVFRNNRVSGTDASFVKHGGGLFAQGTGATGSDTYMRIENSEFSGNTVDTDASGGAIAVIGVRGLTVVNSTLSGNQVGGPGGAVHVLNNTPNFGMRFVLESSTVALNTADTMAGGIYAPGPGVSVSIANSIVAGNSAASQPEIVAMSPTASYSLFGDDAGDAAQIGFVEHQSAIGSVLIDVDPRLGALADNGGDTRTHALLSGSPAIDAGMSAAAPRDQTVPFPTNDQRGSGYPRQQAAAVDIGAFEVIQNTGGGGGNGGNGSGGGGGGGGAIGWMLLSLIATLALRVRRRTFA